MSVDAITAGLDLSLEFLSTVDAYIKNELGKSFIDKLPGADVIIRTIEAEIEKTETVIGSAEKTIKDQIIPLIQNAIPNAIQGIQGAIQALETDVSNILKNLATTEDVIAAVKGGLSASAPTLAPWIADRLTSGLSGGILNALRFIESENPEAINPILDELLAIPNLPDWLKPAITSARERRAPFFAFLLPAIILAAALPILQALAEPSVQFLKQATFYEEPTKEADTGSLLDARQRGFINEDRFISGMRANGINNDISAWMLSLRVPYLEPEILGRLYLRGLIKQDQYESELQKRGYDTERARLNFISQFIPLGEDFTRNAFLRGIFTAPEHDARLALLGYQEPIAALMRQLYFYIPPVADLIHMGIRNVFNPEIVQRFTLDGDYPKPFEVAATQQGVSPEWAHKYWQSHWIMPGREAFFEMFQRTVDKPLDDHADKITLSDGTEVYNIMGRDTLNLALRDIDTPPFYRDKLTQIAYRPLTRIDIRRLAKVGLLTHAGVERAYLNLGYTHENANLLANFVDKLNATTTKNQAQSLVTSLQKRVIELYVADKLKLDQVQQTLQDIGFTSAEITVFVTEADLVHASQRVTAIEQGVGRLYTTERIDAKEATKRLQDAGVPVDAMTTLFDKWDLAREYRDIPEHVLKHRELTKGEILTAMIEGSMPQDIAATMLADLGYDKPSVDTEISLAWYKAEVATTRAIIESIKASFINGVIEIAEASQRLDGLYVPADRRDALLSEWSLQRETRTERIPIATLRDMFKGDYLTEDEVLAHLRRHRYTDADAALLLQFWKQQPPPKRLVSVSGA